MRVCVWHSIQSPLVILFPEIHYLRQIWAITKHCLIKKSKGWFRHNTSASLVLRHSSQMSWISIPPLRGKNGESHPIIIKQDNCPSHNLQKFSALVSPRFAIAIFQWSTCATEFRQLSPIIPNMYPAISNGIKQNRPIVSSYRAKIDCDIAVLKRPRRPGHRNPHCPSNYGDGN